MDEIVIEFDGEEATAIHSNCQKKVDSIIDGELVQHTYCG